jgi:AcrR family transcriptional regulator
VSAQRPDTLPVTSRGRRTRAALVEAAAEIFERDGFFDARIADIAERAGVAHGSFYTYFESKDEIFRVVARTLIDTLFEESHVGARAGPDPADRLAAANRLYAEAVGRHARLYSVLMQVAAVDPELRGARREFRDGFVRRAANGLRSLQEHGLADASIDADLFAAMLCGMVENYTEVRFLLGQPFDEDEALRTLTEIWIRAVRLEPNATGHS